MSDAAKEAIQESRRLDGAEVCIEAPDAEVISRLDWECAYKITRVDRVEYVGPAGEWRVSWPIERRETGPTTYRGAWY